MTKKIIKKLALSSYTGENLDGKKVNRIIKHLGRLDLKTYIKAIKNFENSRTVTLLSPITSSKTRLTKEMKKIFPDKKIVIEKDGNLIAGVRIIDNDTIYDFNVKNTLENLVSYVSQ